MATKPKATAKTPAKTPAKTTPGKESETAKLALRTQAAALRDQADALIAMMNHLWGPPPAPAPGGGGLSPKAAGGAPPAPAVGGGHN